MGQSVARANDSWVLLLEVDGTVNGVKERFITRAINKAMGDEATLMVIELDTPGGFLNSTREIVQALLDAPIPVAVYVSPRGAHAGSAGTFIATAAHFSVMAPGTNIGAATPLPNKGDNSGDTLDIKIEHDAAALIRSIAQERGRNEDKLEETVRYATSFSANEAVALNVVDFMATDLDDLLSKLEGQVVEVASGTSTLDTKDLTYRRFNKNFLDNFLEFISDPNVAFLLFSIGGLGIIIELFNPGLITPGVVGSISILLAFLAFGNLPVNWAGVAFILVAIVLVVMEITVTGFGILGIGAFVSFIVGGLILFGDGAPTMPEPQVSRWLLSAVAGVLGLILMFVVHAIYDARRTGNQTRAPSLVGLSGTVTKQLIPLGVIQVGSETWTAVSEDGNVIRVGESVKIAKVDGLVLTVSRHY